MIDELNLVDRWIKPRLDISVGAILMEMNRMRQDPTINPPKRIFVSGKYSGDSNEEIDKYICLAESAGIELLRAGYDVFVPHTMTAHWDDKAPDILWGRYIDMCIRYLKDCDAIAMLPNWHKSPGARLEYEYAKRFEKPIYIYPDMSKPMWEPFNAQD